MIKLLLLPLIVLLQACAFKSAAVGQLDTFIEYQTGSRLDLYLHQKQQNCSAFDLIQDIPGLFQSVP